LTSIVLFSRPGCHLCDNARKALVEARLQFTETDITADPGLEGEFGTLIPVVEVAGNPVFFAGMDPRDLASLVAEALEEGQ
jgi:glutaredoxin